MGVQWILYGITARPNLWCWTKLTGSRERAVSEGGTLVLVDNSLRQLTVGAGSGMYGVQSDDFLIDDWLQRLNISSSTRDVSSLGGTVGPDATPNRLMVASNTEWPLGVIDEVQTYKRQEIPHPVVYRFAVASDESKTLQTKLKDKLMGDVVV